MLLGKLPEGRVTSSSYAFLEKICASYLVLNLESRPWAHACEWFVSRRKGPKIQSFLKDTKQGNDVQKNAPWMI